MVQHELSVLLPTFQCQNNWMKDRERDCRKQGRGRTGTHTRALLRMERQQRQACGTECIPLQSSLVCGNHTQRNTTKHGGPIIGWPGPLNRAVAEQSKTVQKHQPSCLQPCTRLRVLRFTPLHVHMSLMTHTQTAHNTHAHSVGSNKM